MRVDDFKNARALAAQDLVKINPEQVAKSSGSSWDGEAFTLTFLNREVKVQGPDFQVTWVDQKNGEEFSLTDAVLVLHYLLGAKELTPSGVLVSYRQIPGGEFYYQAFQKRAEIPLAKTFGTNRGLLTKVAGAIGGQIKKDMGDEAALFQVLPHISIMTLIHWGDDEFDPDGKVLFEQIIGHYLHIEDISWLGSTLVYRLMAETRKIAQAT